MDDFEMYIDRKEDKLILVSEIWDTDLLALGKRFDETAVHRMMSEYIIPLLMKLHSKHYIHGDIKPNNLVMNISEDDTFDDEYGLIDFGTMLKVNSVMITLCALPLPVGACHSLVVCVRGYR